MTQFNFVDAAQAGNLKLTNDGYLVADVLTVRTGIQVYKGAECGRPDLKFVRVYRPEAEVFNKDSVASFAHVPITLDHPAEGVDATNWKKYAKGESSSEVMRDGEFLRIPLILKDAAAIKAAQTTHKELSAGYSCDLVFEDGIAPDGSQYDAKQTNIRANHIACVRKGRAGEKCRIGDEADAGSEAPLSWGVSPITVKDEEPKMTLKTITVDGIPLDVTDAGATVIATLQTRINDVNTKLNDTVSAHAAAIADKDKQLGLKDAEIEDLKKKVLSDADIDKLVSDRADIVAKAKKIVDGDYSGKSAPEIRKIVVAKKLGDSVVADQSDDYIKARFDVLHDSASSNVNTQQRKDPVRETLRDHQVNDDDDIKAAAERARATRNAQLQDAYKGPEEKSTQH